MPLMDIASTRIVALEALVTITHHGGLDAHLEIAKHSPTLIRLMEEFPNHCRINELAVTTIAHAAGSAIAAEEEDYDEYFVQTLDVPHILKGVDGAMRKPSTASIVLVDHGMQLIASTSRHIPERIRNLPPLVALMAATLRVNNISARCTAIVTFIRITEAGSEEDNCKFDPNICFSAGRHRPPGHLLGPMNAFGFTQYESNVLSETMPAYQNAMTKIEQDRTRNLVKLGRTLAGLITRTEFAITEGGWHSKGKNGEMEIDDIGLPFRLWTDCLPLCAKELRKAPGAASSDLDAADILDLKFLLIRGRITETVEHAENASSAILRSPTSTTPSVGATTNLKQYAQCRRDC